MDEHHELNVWLLGVGANGSSDALKSPNNSIDPFLQCGVESEQGRGERVIHPIDPWHAT